MSALEEISFTKCSENPLQYAYFSKNKNQKPLPVIALLGKVKDFFRYTAILKDTYKESDNHFLCIRMKDYKCFEFKTLVEAKSFCRTHGPMW